MEQYFYQKIIPNEVINEIEKMIYEGKTYEEIKKITGVSYATIGRVKTKKITSDRVINCEPPKEIKELQMQLLEVRKKMQDLVKENSNLKSEIDKLNNKIKSLEFENYRAYEEIEIIKDEKRSLEKEFEEVKKQDLSLNAGSKKLDVYGDNSRIDVKRLELKEKDMSEIDIAMDTFSSLFGDE